ncbi:hypothetical protein Bpfe_025071, partial [Biomphalaria pfeifferi]
VSAKTEVFCGIGSHDIRISCRFDMHISYHLDMNISWHLDMNISWHLDMNISWNLDMNISCHLYMNTSCHLSSGDEHIMLSEHAHMSSTHEHVISSSQYKGTALYQIINETFLNDYNAKLEMILGRIKNIFFNFTFFVGFSTFTINSFQVLELQMLFRFIIHIIMSLPNQAF